MTLHQLKIVAALIDNDFNLSVTADRLFRVQSAISSQLLLLEEELGGKLFERRGKRLVRLTPLCETLLPEMNRILLAESNIRAFALEHTSSDKGDLRIATTHTQARYFLPEVIRSFRTEYPEVRLSIYQGSPSEFLIMLRQRKIDFAVFSSEEDVPADFSRTRCYSWHRVLILPQGHPLEHTPLDLDRLAQYPIITYMPDFAERQIIEHTFSEAGIPINIAFSAGDTDIIQTFVRLNLGIAIVAQMAQPKSPVSVDDETLVFRDIRHLFVPSSTYVVYLEELALRGYMNRFAKMLKRHGRRFQKQLNRSHIT